MDFIGFFPTTSNGNQYIITAIDYATGWPITKAVKNVEAETITKFLIQEIFMYYGLPKELLSDNGTNFLANVVKHYLQKLHTQHRYMTAYHPRTNEKVKKFNSILGNMLINYLAGKSTKLWDEYLLQVLFATRIWVYSTLKYSPYYLLYSQHLHLLFDDDTFWPLEVVVMTTAEYEKKITYLWNARSITNEALFERAIKAKKVRKKRVKKRDCQPILVG